jgi:hypothetical protein
MRSGTALERAGMLSGIVERVTTRAIAALTLYLARPQGRFSTLTSADREALGAVLRPGDVLLSAGNTRFAGVVKRLTQSTWSHVSMYVGGLDDAADPRCVVEADIATGVRAIRLSEVEAHRVCVLRPVGLADSERARVAECALGFLGSGYDVAHAWQLARSLVAPSWWAHLRVVRRTIRRSATSFICSTLIAQAFGLIGYSILPASGTARDADADALVPGDFERAALFSVVWPVDLTRG